MNGGSTRAKKIEIMIAGKNDAHWKVDLDKRVASSLPSKSKGFVFSLSTNSAHSFPHIPVLTDGHDWFVTFL